MQSTVHVFVFGLPNFISHLSKATAGKSWHIDATIPLCHNSLKYKPHTRNVNSVSAQDVLHILYVIMNEAPKKLWGLP
jgi:hypothetical protein